MQHMLDMSWRKISVYIANLLYFYKALMELLDKVQFSYDTSDQDVKDITDGEWQHVRFNFQQVKLSYDILRMLFKC